jgi:hypothetical protein
VASITRFGPQQRQQAIEGREIALSRGDEGLALTAPRDQTERRPFR